MFVALMFFVSLMFLFSYHCWLVAKNRSTLGERWHTFLREYPTIYAMYIYFLIQGNQENCGMKTHSNLVPFPFCRGLLSSSICQWTWQKRVQSWPTQKPAASVWRKPQTVVHPCFHKVITIGDRKFLLTETSNIIIKKNRKVVLYVNKTKQKYTE